MKEVNAIQFLFFIKQLCLQLFIRWRLALLLLAIISIISAVTFFVQKPRYQATVTFIKQNPVLKIKGVLGAPGEALTASSIFGDDYISELFTSKDFVETALQQPAAWLGSNKLMLDAYWSNNWKTAAGLQKNIRTVPDTLKLNAALRFTAAKIIRQNLASLRQDKQLDYFTVSIVHPNEKFAYEFCTLLSAYAIELHNNMYMARVNADVQLLQSKTDSIRRSLYASMLAVAQRTDLDINALKEIVRTGVAKKEIEANINIALYTDVHNQLELAQLTTQVSNPVIKIIERPWLPLQKEQPWYHRLWSLCLLLILGVHIFISMHGFNKKFANE